MSDERQSSRRTTGWDLLTWRESAVGSDDALGGQATRPHPALAWLLLHSQETRQRGGIGMKPHRRNFLQLATSAAVLRATMRHARALDYPTRPVHLIEGFGAGGAPDIVARLIGQALSERLRQSLVVENRTGSASNIAAEHVARSTPDGYTLLLLTTANAINATMYKLSFDLIRDLIPIASVCQVPEVMEVNPSVPARTMTEFVAYAKTAPGKINLASAGIGTIRV